MQLPDVGVIVYIAVCDVLPGLLSDPFIFDCPAAADPPVTPPVTAGTGQL